MYTVYGAYRNSNMDDGRGSMVLDRLFALERDAYEYISMQSGVFGRNLKSMGKESWDGLGDWKVEPLQVMENPIDGEEYQRKMTIQRGMSRLRPDEIEALGLQKYVDKQ